MSMFEATQAVCPVCGAEAKFDVVMSVNADRRPDLRAAILDESFQRQSCAACGASFRVAPDLNYLDVGRGRWIAAHPPAEVSDWLALEDRDRATFDQAYGAGAAQPAREVGAGLQARITFGWPGLREKLLAADQDLDDVELELLKLAIIRSSEEAALRDDTELRLVAARGDELEFAWLGLMTEQVLETLVVPWAAYDEIRRDAGWAELRARFAGALYVDLNRFMVASDAPTTT